MDIRKLIEDKTGTGDDISLTRTVALGTSLVLSIGFILLSLKGRALWETFLAYPAGISLTFAPQLFLRLVDGVKDAIKAWKGGDAQREE